MNTLVCTLCNKEKPLKEFSKRNSRSKGFRNKPGKGYGSMCKQCVRDTQRDSVLKYRYGITREDYNKMFEAQKGKCLICKRHQSDLIKSLSVDHNHKTGEVRGLLCDHCNTALGLLKEDSKILLACIDYLEGKLITT